MLISACSAGHDEASPGGDLDREVREALTRRVQSDIADDLGIKITDDRPIRHEFRLRNPTDSPIRLVNATALKTCCSSIGPIPRMVPARGEALVPVIWKADHQAGRKRVQFVVATDRADSRTIDLSLTADLLPAWEVWPLDDSSGDPSAAATSVRTYRVITRRLADEGLPPPSGIDSTGPFRVRFVGDATQESRPDRIVEASRVIEVALSPPQSVGFYSGELLLKWADGASKTYSINREVSPHLRAIPSTLVVNAKEGSRTFKVIVKSRERPFRIFEVIGQALINPIVPNPDPAVTHSFAVELDPSRLDRSKTPDIEITTDHPDQSSLKIKVFLVASGQGEAP